MQQGIIGGLFLGIISFVEIAMMKIQMKNQMQQAEEMQKMQMERYMQELKLSRPGKKSKGCYDSFESS